MGSQTNRQGAKGLHCTERSQLLLATLDSVRVGGGGGGAGAGMATASSSGMT